MNPTDKFKNKTIIKQEHHDHHAHKYEW